MMKLDYVSPISKGVEHVNQNWKALHRELEKQGGQVHNHIPANAEFLIVRDHQQYYGHPYTFAAQFEVHEAELKVFHVADLHEIGAVTYERRAALMEPFDLIISPYAHHPLMDIYRAMIPGLKVLECPWWIDPKLFHPGDELRPYDITLIGRLNKQYYPLRSLMATALEELSEDLNIKIIDTHPGYMNPNTGPDCYWGEKYARLLRETKVLAFGNSIFRYPLFKYYEGLASGCFIMAPTPLGAEHLEHGLCRIDAYGVLKEQITGWLEYLPFSLKDMNMSWVTKTHTAQKRAEFMSKLQDYVQ